MNASEIRRTDKLVAIGLALIATVAAMLALAAPAGAATYGNGFKLAKFKVEVKGWQKMVQQSTHAPADECDVSDFSSGSEKFNFATTKPFYVIASHMKGQDNPSFFATKQLAIPTKAVVKRSYTPRVSMPAVACEDNGGGVATTYQADCGTKTVVPFGVRLEYAQQKKGALVLSSYHSVEDPFERCNGAGYMTFPNLLVERSGEGQFIYADLSQDELFDPGFRKWISIAEGTRKERDDDYWVKTTVHWEVSFTRLKEKPAANVMN
jgi:hypothetical protein